MSRAERIQRGRARDPRADAAPSGPDLWWLGVLGAARRRGLNGGPAGGGRGSRFIGRARSAARRAGPTDRLGEGELDDQLGAARERVRRGRAGAGELEDAVLLTAEAARRAIGLAAHTEQLAAALALLDGCVIEQATGEGKTLTATLAACVWGWAGEGVHVVTVNDYLARRDAEWMGPVYARCGLRVGVVTGEMTDAAARARAYGAGVTYTTNKQVAADWLRERLRGAGEEAGERGRVRRVRGETHGGGAEERGEGPEAVAGPGGVVRRARAIVDEADSVLIDEAVTPLVLSGRAPNAARAEALARAAEVAQRLRAGRHYTVDKRRRTAELTGPGRREIGRVSAGWGGVWEGPRRREELVARAVEAETLYTRGEAYVVEAGDAAGRSAAAGGRVVIVDESTGRLMWDRRWRAGLHEAVEAKEGLLRGNGSAAGAGSVTLARVSFQRFFAGYRRLAGMTGTAWEVRGELWTTYRLPVVRLPTHAPVRRRWLGEEVLADEPRKWARVVALVRAAREDGRPVLVGTRTVGASERLSAMLTAAGVPHRVLNAVRHAEEAEVIARAGEQDASGLGVVTIATNMAGRGTDIRLSDAARDAGGLAVIATERHESRRIDRQLFGRAGRQGDPGSARVVASTRDAVLERFGGPAARGLARAGLAGAALRLSQARAERLTRRRRRSVQRADERIDEGLGWAGA